ncbi:fasciclin domain-containing protein [Gloeothece verrucosa]|uniref:Beta-Ig-H3/fasciclin n=1 Tax=Gloeothece verrucosa (strain PCC 7822) TaxID=497965 RepID=E0UKR7_GLOV7|nr:fasciclin domain-containing protein [Gloeothece verrucosa]ADN17547.1 beta-Ig-H3/fasciclin [Gloeothece verrucosa PCC 7822]
MPDLLDTAINAGCFTTLVDAINAASMAQALKTEGPFTVFAPTDEAFSKLPSGTVETLLENIPDLIAILRYHIIPDQIILAADIPQNQSLETSEGSSVKIQVSDDSIHINEAKVINTDVKADNGVIHVIDSVIIPQSMGKLLALN